jgi:hypothetical protein
MADAPGKGGVGDPNLATSSVQLAQIQAEVTEEIPASQSAGSKADQHNRMKSGKLEERVGY